MSVSVVSCLLARSLARSFSCSAPLPLPRPEVPSATTATPYPRTPALRPTPDASGGDLLASASAACCSSCCSSRCVYLSCPLLTRFLFPSSPQYGSHSIVLSPSHFPDRPSAPLRLHPAPDASRHCRKIKKTHSESALSRCRRAPFCLFLSPDRVALVRCRQPPSCFCLRCRRARLCCVSTK